MPNQSCMRCWQLLRTAEERDRLLCLPCLESEDKIDALPRRRV